MARIQHIARRADWIDATRTGTYRTPDRQGFIHAARPDQVPGVFSRHYANGHEPLVLLTIETERLLSEVRETVVGEDTFPHIYGPINRTAVVDVQPLDKRGGTESFVLAYVAEMAVRAGLAVGAMMLSLAGAALGRVVSTADPAALVGALGGLALGLTLMILVLRRRD